MEEVLLVSSLVGYGMMRFINLYRKRDDIYQNDIYITRENKKFLKSILVNSEEQRSVELEKLNRRLRLLTEWRKKNMIYRAFYSSAEYLQKYGEGSCNIIRYY